MGYSHAAISGFALDSMLRQLQENNAGKGDTFNGWKYKGVDYFYEQGRENYDGSITGSVWKFLPDGLHARRAGCIKIDSRGNVVKFTTSSKIQREKAKEWADSEMKRIYVKEFNESYVFLKD